MPCISSDGKPTASGMQMLQALKSNTLSAEEVADKTGQPLFKVRSGLRELKNAGFIDEKDEKFSLTTTGLKLAES